MLFPYIYVPHQMEKMQTFIDFIFYEVWCKAPIGLAFRPDLFEGNPDLKAIMSEFGFSARAPERGRTFYKEVRSIYELFGSLSAQDIDQFKEWYRGNNNLEKVCANDTACIIVRYKEIAQKHPMLYKQIATFFRGLYDKSLLNLEHLRNQIGKIEAHNRAFFEINKIGKCPFCGLSDLKGIHHTRREAYDHYLPKYRYPFNSINFRNLAPACHECNSVYKLSKDPAYESSDRRKAFYPYAAHNYRIRLEVQLKHADITHLTPKDIRLKFGPSEISEEIDTWRDLYGIDERYKAKLLSNDGGTYWLIQVIDEWCVDDRQPIGYLTTLARHTEGQAYAESNFLKESFLEACRQLGLFDIPKSAASALLAVLTGK